MSEEQHISVQSEEEQGDGGEEAQRRVEKQATGRNVAEDVEASNGHVANEVASPVPMDTQEGEEHTQEATPTIEIGEIEETRSGGVSGEGVGGDDVGVCGDDVGVGGEGVGGEGEGVGGGAEDVDGEGVGGDGDGDGVGEGGDGVGGDGEGGDGEGGDGVGVGGEREGVCCDGVGGEAEDVDGEGVGGEGENVGGGEEGEGVGRGGEGEDVGGGGEGEGGDVDGVGGGGEGEGGGGGGEGEVVGVGGVSSEGVSGDGIISSVVSDVSSEDGGVSGDGVVGEGGGVDSSMEEEPVERTEEEIKFWASVKENPSDFTSWTSLLHLVEQKGAIVPAREVFDAFLQFFPYCYGYWKKYADLEKKRHKRAEKVFEEGVKAIPHSVDLWLHYAGFTVSCYTDTPRGDDIIRSVYEQAIHSCGLEYRSAKIWDSYIDWEMGSGRLPQVVAIYDQLLAIPTQNLLQHFEKFKKLLECTPTSQLLSEEEYGDITSQAGDSNMGEAVLEGYVRRAALGRRTKLFDVSRIELEKRRHFEEPIKRPYFHIKPLERAQLKNWKEYLDFEVAEGNRERIVFLFERCVIACALYEDFWAKYCKYAEVHIPEQASAIYRRACTVHLKQKPNIHLSWAALEEKKGDLSLAREVLHSIDQRVPGLVSVRLRRIGLEVRAGFYEQADTLYRESLTATMALATRNFFAWRYARFAQKLLGDQTKAVSVMTSAVQTDSSNAVLYLQLLDLHTSTFPPDLAGAETLFQRVSVCQSLTEDVKESFAQRRQQLLEEFGGEISVLLEATDEVQRLKKLTKKRAASESEGEPAKRVCTDPSTPVATPTATPTMVQGGVAGPQVPMAPNQQQWPVYPPHPHPHPHQHHSHPHQQQQWGGYSYGQQGYNYPGYYSPYSYGPPHPS